MDRGVIAMKVYSTFPKAPGLELYPSDDLVSYPWLSLVYSTVIADGTKIVFKAVDML